jgi:hypothetical protein
MIDDQYRSKWNSSPELSIHGGTPNNHFYWGTSIDGNLHVSTDRWGCPRLGVGQTLFGSLNLLSLDGQNVPCRNREVK